MPDVPARGAALGCTEAGCELLLPGDGPLLHASPQYRLPPRARFEGLVANGERLCAYGEGLYCTENGVFREAVSFERSGTIVAVSLGDPAVAVSADGVVFFEEGEQWQSRQTNMAHPVSVDVRDGMISLHAADGEWQLLPISGPVPASCRQQPPLLHASLAERLARWLVLNQAGESFLQVRQPDGELAWCKVGRDIPAKVLAVSEIECSGPHLFALTDVEILSVFGGALCVID